jgi:hypothetical protein
MRNRRLKGKPEPRRNVPGMTKKQSFRSTARSSH